jgi:2-polyprenyl-3-methyl-5-hydroxy-6-metoxy-1,4-benzoquinol methylase
MGYCPLTEWHFNVLQKLGKSDIPNSYIKYLADRLTGLDFNASLVDDVTLYSFLVSLIISIVLNIKDRNVIKKPYVCPAKYSGGLDNPLRKFFQDPQKIVGNFIRPGMTVLDLGCGPGYFSVEIAKMVGKSGRVIAADIQMEMLEKIRNKIAGTELEQRIKLHKCQAHTTGVTEKVDFIFAFYMIHEVPDQENLYKELKSIINPGGMLFISEPKIHVTGKAFKKMVTGLEKYGFELIQKPGFFFSRSILLSVRNAD